MSKPLDINGVKVLVGDLIMWSTRGFNVKHKSNTQLSTVNRVTAKHAHVLDTEFQHYAIPLGEVRVLERGGTKL